MKYFGLILIAGGYGLFYWSANILVQAYKRTGDMNPPTLAMCLAIPGAEQSQPATTTGLAPAPPITPQTNPGTGAVTTFNPNASSFGGFGQ